VITVLRRDSLGNRSAVCARTGAHRTHLSVSSGIGFLSAVGVSGADRRSVYISYANELRQGGKDIADARAMQPCWIAADHDDRAGAAFGLLPAALATGVERTRSDLFALVIVEDCSRGWLISVFLCRYLRNGSKTRGQARV